MLKVQLPDGSIKQFPDVDPLNVDAETIRNILVVEHPELRNVPDGTWRGDDLLIFARPQGGTKA